MSESSGDEPDEDLLSNLLAPDLDDPTNEYGLDADGNLERITWAKQVINAQQKGLIHSAAEEQTATHLFYHPGTTGTREEKARGRLVRKRPLRPVSEDALIMNKDVDWSVWNRYTHRFDTTIISVEDLLKLEREMQMPRMPRHVRERVFHQVRRLSIPVS